MNTANLPLTTERVRHTLKVRAVEVLRTQRLSPHCVSVTFGGAALHDFASASFDDHVKLMLPASPEAELLLPVPGPDGPKMPEGAPRPLMRDYTPRRFDAAAAELDIEFMLHGDGPAARWAATVAPGMKAGIGGPRSSFVVPVGFDWHLLIGDESALPAIARRLEELPATARAIAVIETVDEADRRTLATRAQLELHWLNGDSREALADVVGRLHLPAGEGYAWAAGEAAAMAATRQVLVGTHGLSKERVRAAAYWKRGAAGHHENL
jgi:NADPH-dependent ferric siderophore reductase